jgi:Tol biopolymer transport system component
MKWRIGEKHFLRQGLLLMAAVFLVIACQLGGGEAPRAEEKPPSLTTNPAVHSSPSALDTAVPLTFTPIPIPYDDRLPSLEPHEILTSDFTDEEFQDLIIFNSLQYGQAAFANFQLDIHWAEGLEPHIFAFSPDGQRAGTLIPTNFVSYVHLPSNPADKPMLVEYGVDFNHPEMQGVELPPECYQASTSGEEFIPCSRLQFSPDGRYLGFFYGPTECWRAIIIQDTHTGVQVYHSMQANGHYFTLLDNGRALIATGHCEGGGIQLYDLDSRGAWVKQLGAEGSQSWNIDKSAFVVEVSSYAGIDTSIWGFNLETDQLFMNILDIPQIDDHPVWTPDRQYLLYQHRTFSRSIDGYSPTAFDHPRQIILVDARSGDQQILLSNSAYDFHIGSCWSCEEWYGDWIQIRQVAFTPESIKGGDDMYTSQEFTCRMYGENCTSPVELYAQNWKTGELRHWSEIMASGLIPNPDLIETPPEPAQLLPVYEQPQGQYTLYNGPEENTFWIDWRWGGEGGAMLLSGPNLTTEPIYEHPSGLYAYYIGIDGMSLWMVPDEGVPLPWVIGGWNYFYLGKK